MKKKKKIFMEKKEVLKKALFKSQKASHLSPPIFFVFFLGFRKIFKKAPQVFKKFLISLFPKSEAVGRPVGDIFSPFKQSIEKKAILGGILDNIELKWGQISKRLSIKAHRRSFLKSIFESFVDNFC